MSIADKLKTVNDNVERVYNAGKKAEYDRFWDAFQENGNRPSYPFAFSGKCWSKDTFTPKYKITLTQQSRNAIGLFRYFGWAGDKNNMASLTFDMLDLTNISENSTEIFYNSWFERLEVDLTVSPVFDNMKNTFVGSDGGRIHHLCVKMKPKSMKDAFHYLLWLKTLTFVEGSEIGCNGFDINKSTELDKASLLGVFDVLVDKSADTSGTSWVVTLGATNLAKLSDSEKAIATQKGWTLA